MSAIIRHSLRLDCFDKDALAELTELAITTPTVDEIESLRDTCRNEADDVVAEAKNEAPEEENHVVQARWRIDAIMATFWWMKAPPPPRHRVVCPKAKLENRTDLGVTMLDTIRNDCLALTAK